MSRDAGVAGMAFAVKLSFALVACGLAVVRTGVTPAILLAVAVAVVLILRPAPKTRRPPPGDGTAQPASG